MARRTLGTNIATAMGNNAMQMMDQTGPYGSVRHRQTGTHRFTDPSTGFSTTLPTYTATTELNPAERRAYDAAAGARTAAGDGAAAAARMWLDRSGVGPFKGDDFTSGDAIAGRAAEIGGTATTADEIVAMERERLDPHYARMRAGLDSELAARGITRDSEAYDRERERLSHAENDARTRMHLGALESAHRRSMDVRRQAHAELSGDRRMGLAEHSESLNEALRGFGALSGAMGERGAGVGPVAPGGFAGVDMGALDRSQYEADLGVYNAKMAERAAAFGALGKLAGTGIETFGRLKTGGR